MRLTKLKKLILLDNVNQVMKKNDNSIKLAFNKCENQGMLQESNLILIIPTPILNHLTFEILHSNTHLEKIGLTPLKVIMIKEVMIDFLSMPGSLCIKT